MLLLALALLADPPVEMVYGDWAVACDNGRACTAVALQPLAWNEEEPTQAQLTRDGGPEAMPRLDLAIPAGARILIDGREIATISATTTAWQLQLSRALAGGKVLTVVGRDGKLLGRVSLAGLGDALRHIDAQQGRIGTVAAIMEPGDEAADRVLPLPALPTFVAIRPPAGAPARLGATQIRAMAARERCGRSRAAVHRIDPATLLVLIPCGSGAYNANTAAFTVRGGQAEPVQFDIGPGWDAAAMLSGARWDAATGMLHHVELGRGIGDCGTRQSWGWDGVRYRLVRAERLEKCRGATRWPVVYRAQLRWR